MREGQATVEGEPNIVTAQQDDGRAFCFECLLCRFGKTKIDIGFDVFRIGSGIDASRIGAAVSRIKEDDFAGERLGGVVHEDEGLRSGCFGSGGPARRCLGSGRLCREGNELLRKFIDDRKNHGDKDCESKEEQNDGSLALLLAAGGLPRRLRAFGGRIEFGPVIIIAVRGSSGTRLRPGRSILPGRPGRSILPGRPD